jgi:hypothetical protein
MIVFLLCSYYRHLVEQGPKASRPLYGMPNEKSAKTIAEDGIHILIDLLGFTAGEPCVRF